MLVLASSVRSVFGPIVLLVPQVTEGGLSLIPNQNDITTISPIAPIWSTEWDVLFPAKTHAPVTTISPKDVYLQSVNHDAFRDYFMKVSSCLRDVLYHLKSISHNKLGEDWEDWEKVAIQT